MKKCYLLPKSVLTEPGLRKFDLNYSDEVALSAYFLEINVP